MYFTRHTSTRYRMLDASAHVLVFPLWEVSILCDAIQVFFYSVILDKVMNVIEDDDRHEMRTKTLVLLSISKSDYCLPTGSSL